MESKSSIEKIFEELAQAQKEISYIKLKSTSNDEEKILLEQQVRRLQSSNGYKDAYEELLIEQFETMRNSFLTKIELINSELNVLKSNSRKQLFYMEEELKQEKYVKELFLRQVNDLQKLVEGQN